MTTGELIKLLRDIDPHGTQQVVLHDTDEDYLFGAARVEGWPQPLRGYPEAVAIVLGDVNGIEEVR